MKTFVLFDIDGTLLYSEKVDSRCFAASYEAVFGERFPTIDWRKFPEVTDHVIFRTAFRQHFGHYPTEAERSVFEEHYLDALQAARAQRPEEFLEVPGAVALWHQLEQDERYLTGIATGGWQRPAALKLAHVGIPPEPAFAGYANNQFSRVDILQMAIDRVTAEYEVDHVVYVGDAVWDVTTTQKMNLPLIGVRRSGDHHTLHIAGASRVITNYAPPTAFLSHLAEITGA